jgi:hypothetical protein
LLVLGLLAGREHRCLAQASAMAVERRPGAEGCPDADTLTTRVERIRGRPTDSLKVGYRVTFAKSDEAFSAIIRSNQEGAGERTLEDHGTTCAALAQATAVTLALLLDSDVETNEAPEPTPSAAPSVAPSAAKPPAAAPPAPTSETRPILRAPVERAPVYSTLAVGGATTSGVVKTIAVALSAEAGISVARWHMGLGVLAGLPEDIALGPGVVRETLLSGTARICYAPVRSGRASFDLCSGGYLGAITAEGETYTTNARQMKSWLAVPLEIGGTYAWDSFALQATASALLPLTRQEFRIDNLGIAYEPWPIAAVFSLRAIAKLKWY